ncbi:hypothetical protein, partial [Micromonospora olivasterospora]
MAAAGPTLELNESWLQALEAFTGMRVSRAKLPLLRDDIGTLGTLEHRVRTVLGPLLEQTIRA